MTRNTDDRQLAGLGRGMWLLFWAALLGFTTFLFQGVIDDMVNPNRNLAQLTGPGGVAEVVLARNAKGHYVADGRINGYPVTFLLDTGATDVALSEGLADRLRLERMGGALSQTANGLVAVWQARLDSVQLGAIDLRDVRASIVPSMGMDSHVLLGMSFLKKLEMVQRDGHLTLRQRPGSN